MRGRLVEPAARTATSVAAVLIIIVWLKDMY
jgi:hypothetical protein